MRLGFISDIHGNFHALERTLSYLAQLQVDQIICLGDVASLGPQPCEVLDCLYQLEIPTILGNHDEYLLSPHRMTSEHPWLKKAEQWCLTQLTDEHVKFLATFQPRLTLNPTPENSILCFHGSPRSNEEWLYPDSQTKLLDEVFSEFSASIYIGGHTHVQLFRQHHGKLFINPGSVGMPFLYPMEGNNQQFFCRAEFATLDITHDSFNVQFHQIPVDYDQLTTIAQASNLPDSEFWLSRWMT